MSGLRIAIMQPYFVPYLGYFRLFSQADLFVIYDCVQFPRRGYVHRNQVPDSRGEPSWLTLPLRKCDRQTLIQDLAWRQEDLPAFVERISTLARHLDPAVLQPGAANWLAALCQFDGSVVDYLERTLRYGCQMLGIPCETVRSSALMVPVSVRGPQRILHICKELGAGLYLNSPGGVDLYDADEFEKAGVELQFLPPYEGSYWSIAYRMLTESPEELRKTL